MFRRLPPLNGLWTFEVSAQYSGFTKATEELHVTLAAISPQVELLDKHLGVQLFRRMTRALMLKEDIEAGRAAQPFPEKINRQTGFFRFLIYPKVHLQRPKVAAFRDWLMK